MIRIGDYIRIKDNSVYFQKPNMYKVAGKSFLTGEDCVLILDRPYQIVHYTNRFGHNFKKGYNRIPIDKVELCTKEVRDKKIKEIFDV